jgi:hypothetical protein
MQDVLLSLGVSVADIAACDCLMTSDLTRVGSPSTDLGVILRIHTLKPTNSMMATVVIEGLYGPSRAPRPISVDRSVETAAVPPPVRQLVGAIADSLQQRMILPRRP